MSAEEPATFRYAVRLERDKDVDGNDLPVYGYDRLEIDTNVKATEIREVKLDGELISYLVESVTEEGFAISFPIVTHDTAILELTFDLPIFRFGTTFSSRVINSMAPSVPQRVESGNAVDFGPGDDAVLSGLAVSIPKPQIGKLVGEIIVSSKFITPNEDGINDQIEVYFNILQITESAPVTFEIFDLSGRAVYTVFERDLGIGPANFTWNGREDYGNVLSPGIYVWSLCVESDAFDEVHMGTVAVVY